MSNLAMMMGLSSGAGGTPWLADLSVASYDSVSFSVGSRACNPNASLIFQTRWYKDVHVGTQPTDLSIFSTAYSRGIYQRASYDSESLLIGSSQESRCKEIFFQ